MPPDDPGFGMLGRWLVITGIALAVVGAVIWVVSRYAGWPSLPGDIVIKRSGFTFYFPLASCLIASIVLTLILYLINLIRH
jgi:hypothetical protein